MSSPFPDLAPESIIAFFDGDVELVRELAEVLLAEAPGQRAAIEEALTNGAGPGITEAAHTFKGSAGALGLGALHAIAERLEAAARAGELDRARQLGRELQETWPTVERVLRTLASG